MALSDHLLQQSSGMGNAQRAWCCQISLQPHIIRRLVLVSGVVAGCVSTQFHAGLAEGRMPVRGSQYTESLEGWHEVGVKHQWHPVKLFMFVFVGVFAIGCIALTWWRRPTWPQSFIADNAVWDGSYPDTLMGRLQALRLLFRNLRSGNSERVKELIQECCGRGPEFHDCNEYQDKTLKSQRSDSFTSLPSNHAPPLSDVSPVEHGLGTMHYWPAANERPRPRAESQVDPGPFWSPGSGTGLELRVGPNYRKSKGKWAANGHLYECISMDVLRSTRKLDRILPELISLPAPIATSGPAWSQGCKLPRIICVNVQAPYRGVNPFGYSDPGCSIVSVFHITSETLQLMRGDSSTWPAPLRLFRDFWQGEAGRLDNRKDPQERATFTPGIFKAVAMCTNIEDCIDGMPMADTAKSFNGKPCLITKSGTLMKDAAGEWMEISVDMRLFATLARTMLALQRDRIAKASIHVGFLIQGVEDDELPEGLIGDAVIHNLDLEKDPLWVP